MPPRLSRIVAGRFDHTLGADAALDALRRDGFSASEIDSFYVAPPGQHALFGIGGDVHSDAGARGAGAGALWGAIIGGFAGTVVGSIASLHIGAEALWLLAGGGAWIGALAGAFARLRGGRPREATLEHPVEPAGGRMIAVCVDRAGTEPRAIAALRRAGARDLGRTEGEWRDGGWSDFDPRAPLATV
jgi:hypothetical protein